MRYLTGMGLALVLPFLATAPPQAGRPLVLVVAPWADPVRAVAHAEGAVLRGTAIPWIVVALSGDAGFPAKLRQAGAWLTLDAFGIAGCASAPGSANS